MGKLGVVKKSKSLSDKAYDIIKEAIIFNKLKPGEILAEEKLAEELQISRTPIKAALLKLVCEEIAEINQSKNVVVSDINQKEIEDITLVRESLESLAVLLLKDNITKSQIQEIKSKYVQQLHMVEDERNEDFIELDYEFHTKISEFTNNSFLSYMIKKANLITKRFLILSGTVNEHASVANKEHEEIVSYIENEQFELASEAMKKHLQNVNERMLVHK
ncbi:DNA-binding GntR family transcriptional regulator [Clostridium butyricum]|uniref:GntR family transcriptional regulator n=1 Tax=Clostridium butyricum TaxID=1492 RepID=UPI001493F7E4|nr:GntR family transcriptional regulator [Clostridium butyricum]MBA8971549.1 DNA-binding GntR family transcriptional regulator [Clostridium butyricum]NOW36586.1 DNA-binding GntR family transcriptional regulator [Clostridium butyricum]